MTPGLIERLEAAGEHTPGPWRAEHTGYYWHVVSSEGTVVDACISQFIGGGTIENPSPREKANAYLAAAAPDLLEALTEARTTLAMLKRNVASEIKAHDGLFRWEGVPEAIQARITECDAAILKARATQEQDTLSRTKANSGEAA